MVVVAAGFTIAVPSHASAAYWTWECSNSYSGQVCWAGTGYLGHKSVLNQLWVQRYEVCAKGVTAAGNTRLGGGNGCGYNTTYRASCFGTTSPASAAYVYWAGSGQPAKNMGTAVDAGTYLPNGLCG